MNILHNLNFVYFTFIQKYLFHIFTILLWREISLLSMWRCIHALERNYNIELKVPWEEYGQNALGCKPTNFLLWNLENPIVYCGRNLHISLKKIIFHSDFFINEPWKSCLQKIRKPTSLDMGDALHQCYH